MLELLRNFSVESARYFRLEAFVLQLEKRLDVTENELDHVEHLVLDIIN